MLYITTSVDRSDVNHLLPGRVRKTTPGKTEQTHCNQDNSQRLVHNTSLRGLLLERSFNLTDSLLVQNSKTGMSENRYFFE
jgi:hypothetical protein